MMRTVSRDRRTSSGSGRSGSPMRTMSPASAAMSVPRADGQADVGAGQGRGVVDAVADHDATRVGSRPLTSLTSAFCFRQQLGVDLGDRHLLGDGPRHGRAVAGEQRRSARCRVPAARRAPRRFGPHAVARARSRRGPRRRGRPAATSARPRRVARAARGSIRRKPECPALRAAGACRRRPRAVRPSP